MRGEKIRRPMEYIRTLERFIALEPDMLVPSHHDPVAARVLAGLRKVRDAVRHVHDAVVAGMNEGRTVHQVMAGVTLPPELDLPQGHGKVSWAVKSIWEYYATWFHFDSTTELYPVPAREVYGELADLVGTDALLARAREHLAGGRPLHALHFIEMASAAPRSTSRRCGSISTRTSVAGGVANPEQRLRAELPAIGDRQDRSGAGEPAAGALSAVRGRRGFGTQPRLIEAPAAAA